MKLFIYFLMVVALGVIIYNFTLLDFDDVLGKESTLALIGILSAACVLVLLGILLTSKAIAKRNKD
jgi:hypothetical protein